MRLSGQSFKIMISAVCRQGLLVVIRILLISIVVGITPYHVAVITLMPFNGMVVAVLILVIATTAVFV
jgi:hypothetical protein